MTAALLSQPARVLLARALVAGPAGLHPDEISLDAFYAAVDLVQARLLVFESGDRRLRTTRAGEAAARELRP